MPQRSAVDELNEYIERDELESSCERINQSAKRHELFGQVFHHSPKSDNMGDFIGRLKKTELFRRRQHRKLRSTLNHDYDGNLIDIFDEAGQGEEAPPPPPPPPPFPSSSAKFDSLVFKNAAIASNKAASSDRIPLSPSEGIQDLTTSINSMQFDESVLPTQATVPESKRIQPIYSVHTESQSGDLMTALSRRRRLKHEQDLSYFLGLDIESDYNEEIEPKT